ncbi:MAG: hypothetical protein DKM50_07720 [Candidatus Margulisiibacteriota bacterium]|nr:MAG: hypothetical protein A2X43_05175 [Candidatus Margulisbacteria bacterium GWD2_39_127]PZM79714.1 MAG: hypothetical protein DKM50_07720 [Candidatus Margulisiibacteriota bacterium]HAR63578.1 hypothetical protein [Candidatus Margulisiibacteriota bacterium]HCY37746.1 hypothetical protein [Candidatus Margulisiibacteriota bacterium]
MPKDVQDLICKNIYKKKVSQFLKRKTWKLYYEKKRVQYLDRNEIRDIQLDKLKILLKMAENSSYYKKYIDALNKPIDNITFKDLKKFPILTKEIIREKKHDLIVKDIKYLFPNASGGSTGEPVHFYQDQHYRDNIWASMMIINEMCGWYYGARYARLWGALQDKNAFNKKSNLFWQNTRFYNTFDMSENKLEEYHADMSLFQPEIIISYASSMYLLAKFLKSKGIKPNYPKISIVTTSEPLYPHMRETIESVFRVKCFNRYGGREISAIACECEAHNGLHIMMDNVIIECLDPQTGEEVFDSPGEIVVTDLNNHGMPFIRYRIGDVGIISKERCKCGRNTLRFKQIIGRNTEHFTMQNGRIIHGCFFALKLLGLEGIKAFQFIQDSLSKFTLSIVKTDTFDNLGFDNAINEIKKVIGQDSVLETKFIQSVATTPTGKYRYVSSKVNPENIWTLKKN